MKKYIHPANGLNTNPGTIQKPWKDLSNLESREWDEALIARDTLLHVTKKTRLFNLKNKTIGAYGAGYEPIISSYKLAKNWIQVFPNVWKCKISKLWAPVTYLCFGQLGSYGRRIPYFKVKRGQYKSLPTKDKEWDTESDPKLPSILYVYAPEHPVKYYGAIYYQTAREPVFLVKHSDNITIEDISYQHTSSCIKIFNNDEKSHTGCKIINNKANNVAVLASIVSWSGWIEDFEIRDCIADNCHNHAIFMTKFIRNGLVQNNQINHTGLVESTGSIYIGDSFASKDQDIIIKSNRVEDCKYSRYWPVDGAGIYVDSNSQNTQIIQNAVFNSHVGIKSNSGKPGLRIHDNITNDCDIGYEEGDSDGYDSADTRVYYNNFLNCSLNKYYPTDPIKRPLAAIRYFNKNQVNAKYHFYSNEITGKSGKSISTRKPINKHNNRFIGFNT